MPEESADPDLVESARRAFEAGNGGDLDLMMSFHGRDPVWDMSMLGMGTSVALDRRGLPLGSRGIVRLGCAAVTTWVDRPISRVTNYTDVGEARAGARRLAESRG